MTPSLALGHKVDLGIECRGVAVSRESIYISSGRFRRMQDRNL